MALGSFCLMQPEMQQQLDSVLMIVHNDTGKYPGDVWRAHLVVILVPQVLPRLAAVVMQLDHDRAIVRLHNTAMRYNSTVSHAFLEAS